jgi:hypothetical protein
LPWGVSVNPFVVARSGGPFNIITGRDTNGDTLFTERPAFATDLSRPSVVFTSFGAFDLDPLPGQSIVPRNLGQSPGFFQVNLRVGKTFEFGGGSSDDEPSSGREQNRGPQGGRGGDRWGRPGGGGRDDDSDEGRFSLELSFNIRNLFNSTNLGQPVGNLSSPFFGRSISTAGGFGFGGGGQVSGNRRIEIELSFEF